AIRAIDQRETPGRVAIGSSTPCPSATNKGQIRSAAVRLVSATIARLQGAERVRRRRRAGKAADVMTWWGLAPHLRPAKPGVAKIPHLLLAGFLEAKPDQWHCVAAGTNRHGGNRNPCP